MKGSKVENRELSRQPTTLVNKVLCKVENRRGSSSQVQLIGSLDQQAIRIEALWHGSMSAGHSRKKMLVCVMQFKAGGGGGGILSRAWLLC
jgi:hypothetical protein